MPPPPLSPPLQPPEEVVCLDEVIDSLQVYPVDRISQPVGNNGCRGATERRDSDSGGDFSEEEEEEEEEEGRW
jgi:hypothetical protein